MPRRPLQCPARVLLGAGQSVAARAADLAVGGIALVVSEQLSPGQSCVVAFALPSSGGTRPVSARATILHCADVGREHFRVGLRFVDIDDVGARFVSEFALSRPGLGEFELSA